MKTKIHIARFSNVLTSAASPNRFSTISLRGIISIAVITVVLLASQQRLASQSTVDKRESVDVELTGTIFQCSESVVGFCAAGTIATGPLKGTKEAAYTGAALSAGMPLVEPATTFSYSGVQVFHTEKGDLHMSIVGVQDTTRLVFTEIARVTGATGRFAGASGNLFISGTVSTDGASFDSRITGEICLDRSSR
ncbi:MAG: hypothetical protein L0Y58_05610, partial [Verrucomicrobia subdivision 3 bacterium]|nr:hypothetical protein [Limisphaerales bacterium]